MKNKLMVIVPFVAAFFLLVGCINLPIGYYVFLRLIVFIASVMQIYLSVVNNKVYAVVINGLIALLFNPISPVYLNSKTTWQILDLVVATWFIYLGFIMIKNHDKDEKE